MLSRAALVVVVVGVVSLPASAQQILGRVETLRGPFQHAVVGSSLVDANGTVRAQAGATLTLPDSAELVRARLYWMGSRVTADNTARLTLPDGRNLDVTAAQCDLATDIASNGNIVDDNYFACSQDVTAQIGNVGLSGRYVVGGVQFDTIGDQAQPLRYCVGGTCEYNLNDAGQRALATGVDALGAPIVNRFVDNTYAGGWTLLVIYKDLEDTRPRVLQYAEGMVAQQNSTRELAALSALKLSSAGAASPTSRSAATTSCSTLAATTNTSTSAAAPAPTATSSPAPAAAS